MESLRINPVSALETGFLVKNPVSKAETGLSSQIIFPNRAENVDRLGGLIKHDEPMPNAARNAPHVAGTDGLLLVADVENTAAFEHHADLLMRMRVLFDDGVRLQVHVGQHHLLR